MGKGISRGTFRVFKGNFVGKVSSSDSRSCSIGVIYDPSLSSPAMIHCSTGPRPDSRSSMRRTSGTK